MHYSYDSLYKDLSGMNVQLQQVAINAAQVQLILFTPKHIPQQVLRPFKYNFTNQMLDDLQGYESLQKAVAPAGGGLTKDSITQAILPDTAGIPLQLDNYSHQWSFILLVDMDNTLPGGSIRQSIAGPKTRLIATGFVVDEPINRTTMWQGTPTVNPNAVLIFTHSTIVYIRSTIDASGRHDSEQTAYNSDIVSELNDQISPHDMFLMTPYDLQEATRATGFNESIRCYSNLALGNRKANAPAYQISASLNSPKHQLGSIMASVDRSLDMIASSGDSPYSGSIFDHGLGADPLDVFKDNFKQSAATVYGSMPKCGLNTDVPITLGDLQRKYPNMAISHYEVPSQGSWSVQPQQSMSKKVVMSSLVASSLSAILPAVGLGDIAFRYCSWSRANEFTKGVWEIQRFGTLAESVASVQLRALNQFKTALETQVFPSILSFGGEFDLLAYVNLTGETLINLNYLDERSAMGDDFYETTYRLGGFICPNTAPMDIVAANSNALDTLLNYIGCNQFGPSPSVSLEHQYQPQPTPNFTPSMPDMSGPANAMPEPIAFSTLTPTHPNNY